MPLNIIAAAKIVHFYSFYWTALQCRLQAIVCGPAEIFMVANASWMSK